ncbi:hypothetical protein ASPNIDRAFT_184754 [Aspergillus niger ATCC 1015]|uniref:Uncharacterized protein n=1 Tax=Aspergillus niger (strain ATCC 1015 / CBS 113.46 / FGSC A1144 / LSHB Ac4 / NCTC 3858a / NRRL 328 / USDA 3528.7) TaxID=380704 RepID=G3XNH6_ASPNA|nr:hypothetical protein ASPNIDRAFT_184754 [Aspergillus niger ATCC 1015]
MEDGSEISRLAPELSDLEVALFLCLAAHQHCRIDTTDANIHDVAKELALICTNTFGLSYSILDCSSATSLDDFRAELLPPGEVVNVVIAKNFNHVNDNIQREALELMHSKQLTTPAGVLEAPNNFLFLPLIVRDETHPINPHLVFVRIIRYPQTRSSNEERPSLRRQHKNNNQLLGQLQQLSTTVSMGADIARYQQDIVVFLRLSRAVAGGISTRSNLYFKSFSK